MEKQLIFFDIDGTLLDQNKKLPPSAKEAVQRLKMKGHEVALATGRAPFMFKDLLEELDIHTFVSFNGQYVVCNKEVIHKNPLSEKSLDLLLQYAVERKHPLVFLDQANMRSTMEEHPYLKESLSNIKGNNPLIHDPAYFKNREIYQTLLFCLDEEQSSYTGTFKDLTFIRWHPFTADVLPAGGSKAKGIEAVIRHLGIKQEHVYAFGDGLNDLEMLRFVRNSFAMGNAPLLVKETAKYITKDAGDDGILYGLEMAGLL
ncbi:Cof subfamily protein (haloacid dehalogenase superfamily) [Peribacillus deserti]|uniref:Cof subfamily protein (Haloacid dehalogenase superfamily) n=1 Tax=Peribacillus deserti TaxID=673318 RepID=A0ABS2QH12_9BACI|nr:Cof-type HAD-IIB family hydrolase [Peribacillus deserti]MBM7692114.1 Cof subfamily protein (haloacid dehalogenase superfamily) [Peribacillus deserti]